MGRGEGQRVCRSPEVAWATSPPLPSPRLIKEAATIEAECKALVHADELQRSRPRCAASSRNSVPPQRTQNAPRPTAVPPRDHPPPRLAPLLQVPRLLPSAQAPVHGHRRRDVRVVPDVPAPPLQEAAARRRLEPPDEPEGQHDDAREGGVVVALGLAREAQLRDRLGRDEHRLHVREPQRRRDPAARGDVEERTGRDYGAAAGGQGGPEQRVPEEEDGDEAQDPAFRVPGTRALGVAMRE